MIFELLIRAIVVMGFNYQTNSVLFQRNYSCEPNGAWEIRIINIF
ncbi:MAG: hypothetical protein ACI81Y_000463 [Glaciecola sp.]|jgi:hypothetical protein